MMFPKTGKPGPKPRKPLQRRTQLRPCRPGKKPQAKRQGRALPPPTSAQQARQDRAREMGCICCLMLGLPLHQHCGAIEIHHQNLDGKAGQKQLGQDFTVALGGWHHRGALPPSETNRSMAEVFGPSLAVSSRAFRARFGDDAAQLAHQNSLIKGHP